MLDKNISLVVKKYLSPKTYFIFGIVSFPLVQLLVQPKWLLSGGIWAEAGTNYFPNSRSTDLLVQLFATDSGYIPLPQRLIALTAEYLNFPAESIPYFYSWTALILSGLLVSVFCLKPFRVLIHSDFSRFLMSLLVLAFSEWGVRTFINFTYYGLFFVAIIGALIFATRNTQIELPWYVWITPILILSKPALLATVPFLIYAITRQLKKRKLLLFVIFLASVIQIIQLIVSRQKGVFDRGGEFNLVSQASDALLYFVGFPGSIVLGIQPIKNHLLIAIFGGVIITLAIWIIQKKDYGHELITAGFSLLTFSLALNAVTLFAHWNTNSWEINAVPITNHSIGSYIGSLLMCFGIVTWSLHKLSAYSFFTISKIAFILASLVWFISSGWFAYLSFRAQQPAWPVTGNSSWVESSSLINSGEKSVCVPLDPIGWVYGPECRGLNWPDWNGTELYLVDANSELPLPPPTELSGETILALQIAVTSLTGRQTFENLEVLFTLKNGNKTIYHGAGMADNSPRGIILSGDPVDIKEIISVELFSRNMAKVSGYTFENEFVPTILWMGK